MKPTLYIALSCICLSFVHLTNAQNTIAEVEAIIRDLPTANSRNTGLMRTMRQAGVSFANHRDLDVIFSDFAQSRGIFDASARIEVPSFLQLNSLGTESLDGKANQKIAPSQR